MPASLENDCLFNNGSSCEKKDHTDVDSSTTQLRQSRRLSNRKSNQMKITSMFPTKRSRSTENVEDNNNKKIKLCPVSPTPTIEEKSSNICNENIPLDEKKNEELVVSEVSNNNDVNLDTKTKLNNNTLDVDKNNGITEMCTNDLKPSQNEFKENGNVEKHDSHTEEIVNNLPDMEKCTICSQYLNNSDIIYYQGHPQNAVEEFIALTNEKLILASGDDGDIMERPQTNITGFSIFDEHGHLCPIDGGLVENDVRIFMSGYLKSICSDSSDIDEESIPVKDVGPVIEWYIHGFDGGEKNCIALSTEFGEYNLLKPSPEYTPLMNNLYERIWVGKVVIEYIEEYHYLQPSYEDLLAILRGHTIPDLDNREMTEEMLHKHAQFICDQVVSLETDEDDEPLITLPCMRKLVKLMGIKFGKRKFHTKISYKKVDKKAWTKATTTPLVQKTFEYFFTDQLDKTNYEHTLRRKRCGVCEACQLPDCGECNACRAMLKFGGHGRTKKACIRRLCPNMAVQQADDSEYEEEEDYEQTAQKRMLDKINDALPVKVLGVNCKNIRWIGEPVKDDATKVYYERVEIDGEELTVGEFVMVETSRSNIPALVARVTYMWKDKNNNNDFYHCEVFIRASETVLGEVGNAREVFLGDRCYHGAPLSSILRKASVEKRDLPKDWFKLGGKEVDEELFEDDGKTYFYQKYYERFTARFEDLPIDPECPNVLRKHRFCPSCERKTRRDAKDIPKVYGKVTEKSDIVTEQNRTEWSNVKWRDNDYKKGCGVFLKPGTFKFKNNSVSQSMSNGKMKLEKVDEDIYPEYYRKSDNNLRGSNVDTSEPFCVGHVAAVVAAGDGPLVAPQDIYLRVHVLYRPENTTSKFPHHEDLNVVYWSDEIKEIPFSAVVGICHLVYVDNIPQEDKIHEWLEMDPSRVYFRQSFDRRSGRFDDVPQHARSVGRRDRGKDKGKGKGKSSKTVEPSVAESVEVKVRPLRTLDVFAGCGGLSDGLHRSGAAKCEWAVENLEAAAHAYSLNNKNCTVFNEDCNELLKAALNGAPNSARGLRLPRQGEVELLCGGPPCQGFSGMNRFNSREYSNFKNSLVVSYLSFCDYYRPKYFILENVRNFVAFKKGMVLKLTLRALLAMGYQCTFGVLQAGNYGVPQTRRRLIILAAAPGYRLPRYPEPTHVFSRRACSLTTTIDGKRFSSDVQWEESAPRRTCTIRDAMSDLPPIANGANRLEIEYGSMPETHFQRTVRSSDDSVKLRDHICKNMAPLIQARIVRIPTTPGSDWRDLPNISVTLSDGTKSKVLQYRYDDKKNGRSGGGAMRGVCACAAGGACSPADKQENTLIPWCLPHTANRHNNWAGLYGRVSWDGYFSTTVTDPEPMGKQGRVLHPQQHRVVSVRECARSQGFRDTYLFAGSVQDKHRQIGNAVPPPLGLALGREIKKALSLSAT
ncbi:DNA (cytosine-5)-methyltransferase 1 [Bicyclus anynana]|uniref:DNA (cytosine-5)-methyltransferase n=1 Tax=Bicyclus anynana TaxID=110368 RepID=A0ABM3LR80_BICAN|nr:DNA (cytosine-5)-methyltransferase 1 [Bicyclus anynana]